MVGGVNVIDGGLVGAELRVQLVHARQHDDGHLGVQRGQHDVVAAGGHEYAAVGEDGVAADHHLVAAGHHGEGRRVVDQQRADALLRQLQRELLAHQRRVGLAADHLHVLGLVRLVGRLQEGRDGFGLPVGDDHVVVVDEVRAVLADLLRGVLDVVGDLLLDGVANALRLSESHGRHALQRRLVLQLLHHHVHRQLLVEHGRQRIPEGGRNAVATHLGISPVRSANPLVRSDGFLLNDRDKTQRHGANRESYALLQPTGSYTWAASSADSTPICGCWK